MTQQPEAQPGGPAPQNADPSLRTAIAEQVRERLGWLQEAAEIVGGPGARVEEVFEIATDTRRDAPAPNWTADQVTQVREVAHRFGYGAEQDVPTGLEGGRRISEGGLYWKMLAQDEAIDAENRLATAAVTPVAGEDRGEVTPERQPALITEVTYAGTPYRPLRDDEREAIQRDVDGIGEGIRAERPAMELDQEALLDRALTQMHRAGLQKLLRPGATEYDMARVLAERRARQALRSRLLEALYAPDEPYEPDQMLDDHRAERQEDEVVPFGYEVLPDKGIRQTDKVTGQLREIGEGPFGERVRLLRVDRLYLNQERTAYAQPDSASLMRFMARVADAEQAPNDPIGLVTSNAYASRVPDAIRAGLATGHQHGVAMYGRATLARVKHAPMQPDMDLNQVPGELRMMHDKLLQLSSELEPAA